VEVEGIRVVHVVAHQDDRVVDELEVVEPLVEKSPEDLLDLVDQLDLAHSGDAEKVGGGGTDNEGVTVREVLEPEGVGYVAEDRLAVGDRHDPTAVVDPALQHLDLVLGAVRGEEI